MKEKIRTIVLRDRKLFLLLAAGMGLCIVVGIIYAFVGHSSYTFERNVPGDGESTEEIRIQTGKAAYDYELPVEEKSYTDKELDQAFEEGFAYLKESLLEQNDSLNEIRNDVTLVWEIPDSAISVEWEFEDQDVVDTEGKVHNDEMEEGSVVTHLQATLTYENEDTEVQKCKVYTLRICPKKKTASEKKADAIFQKLKTIEEKTRTKSTFQIPSKILSGTITQRGQKNPFFLMAGLCVVMIPLLILRRFEEEKQERERKKKSAELEYSNILWQFVLLLEAGLTIPSAWKKIVDDFNKKKDHMPKSRTYVYEKMAYSQRQMELGVSYAEVFQEFSESLQLKSYSKLMTLFLQNITKGSKNMLDILKSEEQQAFVERCEQAKRLGEEADTKLLLPMGIMLINILLLLMIPAYMQF